MVLENDRVVFEDIVTIWHLADSLCSMLFSEGTRYLTKASFSLILFNWCFYNNFIICN